MVNKDQISFLNTLFLLIFLFLISCKTPLLLLCPAPTSLVRLLRLLSSIDPAAGAHMTCFISRTNSDDHGRALEGTLLCTFPRRIPGSFTCLQSQAGCLAEVQSLWE